MNCEITKIREKLSELSMEDLAMQHQFYQRQGRNKYQATDLVIGFFEMFLSGGNSLLCWARKIAGLSGWLLSKQGLAQRLSAEVVSFCKSLLVAAINHQVFSGQKVHTSGLFERFSAVYLEDSSCFSLPDNLSSVFPGSYSVRLKGPSATAKIQLRMNLLDEQYTAIELSNFRQNDQSHASAIVPMLKPGDLVLRDLGYWSLAVMRDICQRGAFLVSRYRFNTWVYQAETQMEINLNHYLKTALKQGKKEIDLQVLVGKEERLPLRLVAFKAPPQLEEARKRKAKNDRNTKANHDQAYLNLLGWTIYLTNVAQEVWAPKQVMEAYGFRWRIEMVFKCWKSVFNMAQLFENKQSITPQRVYISFYLVLVWLVLFFTPWLGYFSKILFKKHKRFLSQIKFAQFVKENFKQMAMSDQLEQFIPWILRYCAYDKRSKQINQMQLLSLA